MLNLQPRIAMAFLAGLLVVSCSDVQDRAQIAPVPEVSVVTTTSPTTFSVQQLRYLDVAAWITASEPARWERMLELETRRAAAREALAAAERSTPGAAVPPSVEIGQPAHGGCAIPAHICERESGFDPTAVSSGGTWRGKYQFAQGTWNHAVAGAGYPEYVGTHADQAPEWVQDAAAAWLWNGGAGCGHWNAC